MKSLCALLATLCCVLAVAAAFKAPLPGCQTFQQNQCSGKDVETPESFEAHRWYTPLRGDSDYRDGFQDYGVLVGKAHVEYTADRKEATVTVEVLHKVPTTQFK